MEHRAYVVTELLWDDSSDTCEMLTAAVDHRGRFTVLGDCELEWPPFAESWRQMARWCGMWVREQIGASR